MKLKEWKNEKTTLHLLSQILGKYKISTAFQEPQWAHVILELTVQGFSTGLLHYNDKDYQINVNLLLHQIEVIVEEEVFIINLKDGLTVKYYYESIRDYLESKKINPIVNLIPQEMGYNTPFDQDEEYHHYNEKVAIEALRIMKIAFRAESKFINPLRARKVKPGLFWGTFDITCILIVNEHVPFEDDTKKIERAAFDESMIEFGFWFGDSKFEGPTFFVLPYPFANKSFECNHSFPQGSYYDESMAEFIITLEDLLEDEEKIQQFFHASYESFKDYLNWENCNHFHLPLKMQENYTCKESKDEYQTW